MDLFTINESGRFCVHKATGTLMIIKKAKWFKQQVDYCCLVPQEDVKGIRIFCDATYSADEIELLDMWIEEVK